MVILKRPDEIEKIRESGRLVARLLDEVEAALRPGMSTWQLEEVAEQWVRTRGVRPAFKGYRMGRKVFPCCLCLSVNEEVVHGIPSRERYLEEGDVISVDFGIEREGYFADGARTMAVGEVEQTSELLLGVTREALDQGIQQLFPQNNLENIGVAIASHVRANGFCVVREFAGHGIGRSLHEDPQVPNDGRPGKGIRLKAGMVLAVEPMVNAGTHEVEVLPNGWTVVTKDGQRSAHFEHTIAVTKDGPWVLTCP